MKTFRLVRQVGLMLLLACWNTGCRIVQTAADIPGQAVRTVTPGQKDGQAADPVEVQQQLLRFSNEYFTRMTLGVDSLRRGTNALTRAERLRWKISVGTETCAIASGPNSVANLLDMTAFVTVTRATMEVLLAAGGHGDSATAMLDSCRSAETEIWRLAGQVLNPAQQTELRQAIEAWRRQNPLLADVLSARTAGFISQVTRASKTDKARPDSVFALLRVDPLASMDPAVREVAQARMFAERALFVTQKMPTLLRWQTELLSIEATELPAVAQVVTNSTQFTAAVDRLARVAEQLPEQLKAEREAILQELQSQEGQLAELAREVRETLGVGTQMSTSLNTTFTTFDALMGRFGVGETNRVSSKETHSAPFRIQDYAATAAQLQSTALQLTELLIVFDRTLGSTNLTQLAVQIGPVVQQAQAAGKGVVDYAFKKGVLLLALALAAALIYRYLTSRMAAPRSEAGRGNRP
jgi:hypothetical protein